MLLSFLRYAAGQRVIILTRVQQVATQVPLRFEECILRQRGLSCDFRMPAKHAGHKYGISTAKIIGGMLHSGIGTIIQCILAQGIQPIPTKGMVQVIRLVEL